ncbi:cupin domain-containing protein [Sphingomonas profundi]|uniref:cupin domain-containing protein n=1 Tax=Alterirhizorhabdus profundi TaxID=2681549 RepID=UPI0012E85FE4|nr:AraC family ligand binding domain-containing protein [Sphingomonas profundi]
MEARAQFVDVSGKAPEAPEVWPSIVITREEIEAEVERLANAPKPANGVRSTNLVHPLAKAPGLGLAPGIDARIEVLNPGEHALVRRANSNAVGTCIRGTGRARIGGATIDFTAHDVWNVPSMHPVIYENDGDDIQARLIFSNQPMLEKQLVHYAEQATDEDSSERWFAAAEAAIPDGPRAKDSAPVVPIGGGAFLMPYEHLVDPDTVTNAALHWPWEVVEPRLKAVRAIGDGYTGRRLYILYNPATERRNGTTHSFFASIASYPGNVVDRPHRHSSAAINYWFGGSGRSTVDGQKLTWKAGDLMLSAPGWSVHNHASGPDGFYSLTIQDHPLMIAQESLIWQETMKDPIKNLGTQIGFQTNIADLVNS